MTRLSAILHGVWLLVFVVALAGFLQMIPTASLAAVLVYFMFAYRGAQSPRQRVPALD